MADATLKMILLGQDRGAGRALHNVGDEADRAEGHAGRLGAAFSKAGKLAVLGLGAGLAVAGVAAVKFAKAAAEDQQAAALMAKQFRNSAHATDAQVASTEKWISKQGLAKGVADDDLRPALSQLVTATHDVGKAQSLASLAMDISAAKGLSLGQVAKSLAKAQNGNVAGLARLGVQTKDATGKTISFTEATKQMSEQFGGAATTKANTLQGKIGRLKLVLSETAESIGYKLLPILTDMATWILQKAVPAVENFFSGMQKGQGTAGVLGNILGKVRDVIVAVAHWVGNELVPELGRLKDKFVEAIGGSAGFKKILENLHPTIVLVKTILSVLWAGLKFAAEHYLPVAIAQFKNFIRVVGALSQAAIWLWNNAFQPSIKFIIKGIGLMMNKFGDMLGVLGHVPGFGWAKDAAEKLHNAANKANDLADGIKKIPNKKTVTVTYEQKIRYSNNSGIGGADKGSYKRNAVGTRFFSGGMTMVGERGPEVVNLSRGSSIATAQNSRMDATAAPQPIVINVNGALDSNAVSRQIIDLLNKAYRQQGLKPAFIKS